MAFERSMIKDTEDGITGEEKSGHRIDKLGICSFPWLYYWVSF